MIYHQLQSEKREKRRSSYMSLMINDLLARSIIAFLFRVDIESAPQWLSEKKEKEMQRLKNKMMKKKKKEEGEEEEKQKLLLLSAWSCWAAMWQCVLSREMIPNQLYCGTS